MMKNVYLISIFIVVLLSSCIFFQSVNQPSVSLPNEIVTVSISAMAEKGNEEPYFGVCLPIGWTIPGDLIQCSGAYNEVIYYDSLVSLEQESVSPAPQGYYWWAGNGIPDPEADGSVCADLNIQTDSQVGIFSIDYMLGNGYDGVNQHRSDDHLIEITADPIIMLVSPDRGYQNYAMEVSIQGFNSLFSDGLGTQNVWLSKNSNEIYANNYIVNSNTSLDANISIPPNAQLGLWDVNVETDFDDIITKEDGFEILPPIPAISVSTDSIYIEALPGTIVTKIITLSNAGWNDLLFKIFGSAGYALQFDGINDEVFVGFSSILDILGDITVSVWYKTESPHWGTLIFNYDQFSPDHGYELCSSSLYGEGGFIYFECAFGDERDGFSTDSSFNDGNWHFASAVYTPDGQSRGKVYVDGIEQPGYFLGSSVPAIGATPDYPFKIGAANRESYFEGIIDEVRLWDRALTRDEIRMNMYNQFTGSEPGLVGYWQFNEGVGDTTFDRTTNSNNGSLVGGVKWVESTVPAYPHRISVSPDSGICYPDSTMELVVTIDATELDSGDYYDALIINSNDPFNLQLIIPVHILVSTTVRVGNELAVLTEYQLEQNYPNPFNPSTTIKYSIPKQSDVTLSIFDVLGSELSILASKELPRGSYKVEFDGSKLTSGIYFYRFQAGDFIKTKKMILLK